MSANHHLVIGCGYLGLRVARAWLAQGHSVSALTRSRASEFSQWGLIPLLGDVTEPASLQFPRSSVQTLLYAVGMDRTAGKTMEEVYLKGLGHVLSALPALPERIIYISSTSVYGQTTGEWVDENSPTEPIEESGRIVLKAEQLLRSVAPHSTILRFAGIYGPQRIIRKTAIERGEPLRADPEKWLNLIHVEDGVQAVLACAEKKTAGQLYCISDGHPPTRREFYTFTGELLGVPAVFEPPAGPTCPETHRRISNQKMLTELGVTLKYPTFREGLRASLQDTSN